VAPPPEVYDLGGAREEEEEGGVDAEVAVNLMPCSKRRLVHVGKDGPEARFRNMLEERDLLERRYSLPAHDTPDDFTSLRAIDERCVAEESASIVQEVIQSCEKQAPAEGAGCHDDD